MTKRISELDAAAQANDTDQLETNQGGTSRRVTRAQLVEHIADEMVAVIVFDASEAVAVGDLAGDIWWRVPAKLNGWTLSAVAGTHRTAGTGSGVETTTVQIHNITDAVDMLSTPLTIDEDEVDSSNAAAAAVVDGAANTVATADHLRFDVDAIPGGTAPLGLYIEMAFSPP